MAVRGAVALLLLLASPAGAEDGPWWAALADSYDGQIFSGRAYASGATEFHRVPPGGLAGSYAFVEPDGTQVDGTLEGCRSIEPPTLTCRWTDKYGSGPALFVFNDGRTGFQGLWFSPTTPKQGMPWTGRRRLGS